MCKFSIPMEFTEGCFAPFDRFGTPPKSNLPQMYTFVSWLSIVFQWFVHILYIPMLVLHCFDYCSILDLRESDVGIFWTCSFVSYFGNSGFPIPSFLRLFFFFNHLKVLYFVKCCFASNEMIIPFSFFHLLIIWSQVNTREGHSPTS